MDSIIVTVMDSSKDFSLDVEIPVDFSIARIKEELHQYLLCSDYKTNYKKFYDKNGGHYEIFCEKLNCILDDEDDIQTVGVSTGDLLVLI